jgi:hypothetical protein
MRLGDEFPHGGHTYVIKTVLLGEDGADATLFAVSAAAPE